MNDEPHYERPDEELSREEVERCARRIADERARETADETARRLALADARSHAREMRRRAFEEAYRRRTAAWQSFTVTSSP